MRQDWLHPDIRNRAVVVCVEKNERRYYLLGIYAPNSDDHGSLAQADFYDKLHRSIASQPQAFIDKLVVAGDFNMILNNRDSMSGHNNSKFFAEKAVENLQMALLKMAGRQMGQRLTANQLFDFLDAGRRRYPDATYFTNNRLTHEDFQNYLKALPVNQRELAQQLGKDFHAVNDIRRLDSLYSKCLVCIREILLPPRLVSTHSWTILHLTRDAGAMAGAFDSSETYPYEVTSYSEPAAIFVDEQDKLFLAHNLIFNSANHNSFSKAQRLSVYSQLLVSEILKVQLSLKELKRQTEMRNRLDISDKALCLPACFLLTKPSLLSRDMKILEKQYMWHAKNHEACWEAFLRTNLPIHQEKATSPEQECQCLEYELFLLQVEVINYSQYLDQPKPQFRSIVELVALCKLEVFGQYREFLSNMNKNKETNEKAMFIGFQKCVV